MVGTDEERKGVAAMACIEPGALSAEALMASVDGEAPPSVAEHLRACADCAAEARRLAGQQRRLQRRLYRFECPAPQQLGEYDLDLLSPAERLRIARHVVDCPRCADELAILRAFLAAPEVPRLLGLPARLRELVAALLPAPAAGALAGVRGALDQATRTYAAGDYRLSIDLAAEGKPARAVVLTGLIWREGDTPEAVGNGAAALVREERTVHTTGIDDLGNFAFEGVRPGVYRLELTLGEERIVVEPLEAA